MSCLLPIILLAASPAPVEAPPRISTTATASARIVSAELVRLNPLAGKRAAAGHTVTRTPRRVLTEFY